MSLLQVNVSHSMLLFHALGFFKVSKNYMGCFGSPYIILVLISSLFAAV